MENPMPIPIDYHTSLLQNVAAISAELHTHTGFSRFYDACGEVINGFVGAYDVCIEMAQALTDWEKDNGGPFVAYDTTDLSWIDVVAIYVDTVMKRMMEAQTAPDYRATLRELPFLTPAEADRPEVVA
jgi:hypothetical protein